MTESAAKARVMVRKKKRTISAKALVADLRSGMDDAAVMEKYAISEEKLREFTARLVEAGALEEPRPAEDRQVSQMPEEKAERAKGNDAYGWIFGLSGILTLAVSLIPIFMALNVIPADESDFGAPRWIVILVALSFTSVGCLLTSMWLHDLTIHRAPLIARILKGVQAISGAGVLLIFLTGGAVFLTYKTLAPCGAESELSIWGISLPLPSSLSTILDRAVTGFFALIMDAMAIAAWWGLIRYYLKGDTGNDSGTGRDG